MSEPLPSAWGVGTTEYANLVYNGFTTVEVPESIRFELPPGCTAGKIDDFVFYHQVFKEEVDNGWKVAPRVQLIIQFSSREVEEYARRAGFLETFERRLVTA
ncbi:MAG TPA: aconitase family protein [Thermoanaerobaculia bacterium]|nr:aconitase family protein [Thermoanaerobaculia bacterium]